jgi:hypothetical protein
MKKEYKSTDTRLVEYFGNSRNQWKERSMKYHREKRALQIQIRDLIRSKKKWKDECIKLRKEINELRDKEKKTKEILLKLINQ